MEKNVLRSIVLIAGLVLFLAGARLVCLRTARPPSPGGRDSSPRFAGKEEGEQNPYLRRDRETRRRPGRRSKTHPSFTPSPADHRFKIITEDLVMGAVGQNYRQLLQARNGSGKLSWKVSKGKLPPGLTLGEKGTLRGRPQEAGEWRFTLEVVDEKGSRASREFRLLIRRNLATPEVVKLGILTKTLPEGYLGKNYLQKMGFKGGLPPYQWLIVKGRLPDLIHLNQAAGVLYGIPRQAGNFRFLLRLRDSSGQTAWGHFNLVIRRQALKIITAALPDAFQMNKYELTLRAEGGKLPYRWKLISGKLPVGMEFDPDRGIITGMPENLGTAELTFSVTDAEGRTDEKAFALKVRETGFGGEAGNFRITTLSLPPATRGQLYTFQLAAEGGKLPYNWTVSQGNLPPSLSLDSSSGKIEGEPEVIDPDGTVFAVLVSDQNKNTAEAYYSLSVYSQLVYLTTGELDPGVAGEEYHFQLQASGGTSPYSWSLVSGNLPAGLSFNSANGLIQGTISASYIGGGTQEFTFRVKVEDQVGNYDIAELRLTVRETVLATPPPSPTPGEGKAEISNLISGSSDGKVGLAWSNPSEFTRIEVRRQTGSYPQTPYAGELAYSGTGDNFVDRGLENGITYFYVVIAYDKNNDPSPIGDNNRISATPQKVSLSGPNDPFADQVIEYRPLSSGGFGPTWTIGEIPEDTDEARKKVVAYQKNPGDCPPGNDYAPVGGGTSWNVAACSTPIGSTCASCYRLNGSGTDADGDFREIAGGQHPTYQKGKYFLYWSTYFGEDTYNSNRALGPPKGYGSYQGSLDVVSLQAKVDDGTSPCGGTIILKFSDNMVVNEDGPDFTIFENVFYIGGDEAKRFMEPAVVAVSQDGDSYYEFPFNYVLHPNDDGSPNCYNPYSYSQGFAGVNPVFSNNNSPDPTDPDVSGGDSFDLGDIKSKNLTWIQYIKITSTGDNWLTDKNGDKVRHVRDVGACSGAGSSGFDLDAVSAIKGHY